MSIDKKRLSAEARHTRSQDHLQAAEREVRIALAALFVAMKHKEEVQAVYSRTAAALREFDS